MIVGVKSVRIGDVVMPVYPPNNPELVPEVQGPFYDDAQVNFNLSFFLDIVIDKFMLLLGYS